MNLKMEWQVRITKPAQKSFGSFLVNKIDLQIQSTASDGKYNPVELVEMAKKNGLETIAITDHDTVSGVKLAMVRAKMVGLRVIPGIEMSVTLEGGEYHILGYGIDIDNENLLKTLSRFQDDRVIRAKKMVGNLQKLGFKITFEDVSKRAKGTVARPHIAMAVLENPANKPMLNGMNSVHDFIENYIVPGKPGYADRERIGAKEAIELIHDTGGAAVWSHPAIYFKNASDLEIVLERLIDFGIDGVEAFSPSHTKENVEILLALAKKYSLMFTAGSDFHQEAPNREIPGDQRPAQTVGDYNTFGYNVTSVVSSLDRKMKERSSAK